MNTKLLVTILIIALTTTISISTSLTNIFAQFVPQNAFFIFKFNANGEGLAINSTGHVFHASPGLDKVTIYDSAGNSIFNFNSPGSPRGIAVNNTGHILVGGANGDHVRIYDPLGNLLLQFGTTGSGDGQFDFPAGIAVNSTGYIFVSELNNDRVQVFDPSGNFLFKFGSFGTGNGQFNEAISIAINNTNHIFVSDFLNSRVQVFDPSGNFLFKFGSFGTGNGQFGGPDGIAFDSFGNIYVVDRNHRVQVFDPSGNFLFKFGSFGTGNGQFVTPIGIAINGTNYIYVDDTVSNPADQRIQVFGITDQIGTPPPTQSGSSQTTGQVTVLGTCGLAFASGAPINYGSLTPNAISTEKNLVLDNTGNVNGTVKVKGGDWLDGSSVKRMHTNATKISNSTSTYAAKITLKLTDQSFGIVIPTANKTTFWQLQANLLSSNFTGSLTQTMNFTVTC